MFGIIRSTAHEISIGLYEESLNRCLIVTLFEKKHKRTSA